MRISILLPFKENFSPTYAGAVSLFINDTLKISKYKNNTIVYGNTSYKNNFKLNYKNISLKKRIFQSQNRKYVEEFIKLEKVNNSDLQSEISSSGRVVSLNNINISSEVSGKLEGDFSIKKGTKFKNCLYLSSSFVHRH